MSEYSSICRRLLTMEQTALVGPAAHVPNLALKPFEFLIGRWRTTGTRPLVPGKKLAGRTSFAWHEGGAFLIMRNEVHEPNFPDGVAIIGSDSVGVGFSMIYFDERGVSRIMAVTVGKNSVTWRHDNPVFGQCLTISKQGDCLVGEGLMSENGGPWKGDLSQVFERVTDQLP